MQSLRSRCLLLTGLFAMAIVVVASGDVPEASSSPHWPIEDSAFHVDGWVVSPATTELTNSIEYVTRQYRRLGDGATVTLTVSTSPASKRIYRTGPEVPFLGSGYTVEGTPQATRWGALMAHRGDDTWLQLHTYGERRGQFGNGLQAWGFSVMDTLLGNSNDYYIARIVALLPQIDSASEEAAVQLADGVFPRLADWYSRL
jgi:hypothetical protein